MRGRAPARHSCATQVLESMAKNGHHPAPRSPTPLWGERRGVRDAEQGTYIVAAVRALDNILRRMQDHQLKKSSRLRPPHLSAIEESKEL